MLPAQQYLKIKGLMLNEWGNRHSVWEELNYSTSEYYTLSGVRNPSFIAVSLPKVIFFTLGFNFFLKVSA